MSKALFMVEDNGIGFDGRYLNRIFRAFQGLHARGDYEGVGMGLTICRRIVEHHGGSITAESAPGQGATFILTLPVKRSREENKR
jgi:light-regulated signal transduction histidine kinase (bacteriophytochrome)